MYLFINMMENFSLEQVIFYYLHFFFFFTLSITHLFLFQITGDVSDIGVGKGKKYSVNFPLKTGITDRKYQKIFKSVIERVVKVYKPSVIVLQCGADSLSDDRIGVFNLTLEVF